MDETRIPVVYTPFAELDLLLGEEGHDPALPPDAAASDEREPETVDALDAQILAGLVSP